MNAITTPNENGGSCFFGPKTMERLSLPITVLSWVCRLIAAAILLQTLFFKFTGAEESVYIFTKLGMEPWGRYGTGTVELIAGILLMLPRTAWLGALLAAGVMAGAIMGHLTKLGIVVMNDGGLLFGLALTVMVCSLITLWIYRRRIPVIGKMFC